jgi:hypothetical protein
MIPRDIFKRIRQLDPRTRSPEGCQKVAGGRSASEDPRCANGTNTTPKGSQNSTALKTVALAPLQGAEYFFMLTGGIAVLLRATAQPPATFWHAFSVRASRFALCSPHLANRISRFTFHVSRFTR